MVDNVPDDAFISVEPCAAIGYSYTCEQPIAWVCGCFCVTCFTFKMFVVVGERCANSIRHIAQTTISPYTYRLYTVVASQPLDVNSNHLYPIGDVKIH